MDRMTQRERADPLPAQSAAMRWAAGAAALVLFALATRTAADPDLWGHLRVGLDALHAGMPTLVDPYSFTQDRPWINHPWLGEVLMAIAYVQGGIAGLALLKGALVFGALVLVWSALRGTDLVARMTVIAVVVVAIGSIASNIRPQLWSLLLLVLLCRTLAADGRRARWTLPLLFALWANLHGGWVVGLGVLCAWAGADVWSDRRKAVEWTALVLASAAATVITPYGTSLWRFTLDTVHVGRDIMDWQPLFRQPTMNWLPIVVVCGGAVWLLLRPQRHRLQVAAALLLLAYGSWRVSRIGPLFAASAAILLAPAIASRWPKRPMRASVSPDPPGTFVAVGVIVLVALAASGWIASTSLRCIDVAGTWVPPANAVSLLAGAPPGRLVTFFDWGQYALWHLGPRLRVSMDGRRETVYSDARVAEHDAILAGDPAGLLTLQSWQAEYVWLPARSAATKAWLASHGYRIELDAADSFVAVREDLPALPAVLPTVASPQRCFPD